MSAPHEPGVGRSARPPAATGVGPGRTAGGAGRGSVGPSDAGGPIEPVGPNDAVEPDDAGVGGAERGMATAELAIVLPAVMLVLLLVLSAIATGASQLRATDAARAGARAAAAGESHAVVVEHAMRLAPDGADVAVSNEGGLVVVTVVAPWPGALAVTSGEVSATARSVPEDELVGEVAP